ncbi:hypothetical protein [Actinomadura sp. 9N407]|uniref:hypothetical protein n=1 Tax=Actinomadura sp. 9N407 TaxID=3375154 RepID=UPI00379015D8
MISAEDLARVLRNAIPFAATDATLPALNAVRLEVSPGGNLAIAATDRYVLSVETPVLMPLEEDDDPDHPAPCEGGFSLALADARNLVKLLPRRGPHRQLLPAVLSVTQKCTRSSWENQQTGEVTDGYEQVTRTLTVEVAEGAAPVRVEFTEVDGGEFVNYRSMLAGHVPGHIDSIAFNPRLLATFTRVTCAEGKATPMEMSLRAERRCSRYGSGSTSRRSSCRCTSPRTAWTCPKYR